VAALVEGSAFAEPDEAHDVSPRDVVQDAGLECGPCVVVPQGGFVVRLRIKAESEGHGIGRIARDVVGGGVVAPRPREVLVVRVGAVELQDRDDDATVIQAICCGGVVRQSVRFAIAIGEASRHGQKKRDHQEGQSHAPDSWAAALAVAVPPVPPVDLGSTPAPTVY
jgi:hypothetical protein